MDKKRIAMLSGVGVVAALVLTLVVVSILRATGVISLPFGEDEETLPIPEITTVSDESTAAAESSGQAVESSAEASSEVVKSGITIVATEETGETFTEDPTEDTTEDETGEETTDATEESTEETTVEPTTKEPPTYRFVEPVLYMEAGEQEMSGLICSDPTAPPVPVYWSSENTAIAEINDGMIFAKAEGVTTLTAKLAGQEITCQVQVHEPTLMVYINYSNLNLLSGEKKQLAVGVEPANTRQNTALTWQSSNTKVATVDKNGVVTAKKAGAARIVGHVGTKYEVYCDVVVEAKLESMTFVDGNISMQPGQTRFLPVSVVPEEAVAGKAIIWQSSKPEVATVDQGGNVHALSPGNTTISVFVGEDYTQCVIMVREPATQAPTQPPTEPPTEAPTQPPTQPPTEAPTQPPTEAPTEAPTQALETEPSLPSSEEATEDVSEGDSTEAVEPPTEEPTQAPETEPETLPPETPEETLPPETEEIPTEEPTQESVDVPETEPETDPVPDKPLPPAPKVTLVFDAGHGGKWVGSSSGAGNYLRTTYQLEKDLTLQVALMAKAYIEEHYEGVTIVMTRTEDVHFSTDQVADLKQRCAIAGAVGANAMISFHFNACGTHDAAGAVILCSRKPTVAAACAGLGNCILDELEKLGIGRRGIATKLLDKSDLDYYAINRHCASYDIPGIVVENCFYDNPAEIPFFDSHDALMRLAIADVKGIAKYFGLREK
ncbi:MAG: Ig-like domain-containing protein [Lachnospiraceae bacterium]|nr:Ig-like domain-containing protein [Lachnospiraceae bacterium]